jgi:very-short-patch-repair endonuclease
MRSEDEPIRGEIRVRGFRRVSHGLFLPENAALDEQEEFLRDLVAWRLVLPEGAVFTHVTAAWLLKWRLPLLPSPAPVFAAVRCDERRPRRAGLVCSRLVEYDESSNRHRARGLPVDSTEEILLRAARDLSHLDLVIVLDSARSLGHLDRRRLSTVLTSRRPGTRALAAAYAVSDPRSESAGETLLRIFLRVMEVDVESQVELRDADGQLIGRADLMVRGTRDVHEYDGAGHRSQQQHRSDLRRERALTQAGYVRRGYTLDDLVNHDAVVMHELDRTLARRHRPERLRRWRRMIELSTYSKSGRARLLNRWRRSMGVTDWA